MVRISALLPSTPNQLERTAVFNSTGWTAKLAGLMLVAKRYGPNLELEVVSRREGAVVKTFDFAS